MASTPNASGDKSGSALLEAEQRRREMVLLLILASVQFTSIVDFMVVMPIGTAVEAESGDQSRDEVWVDCVVIYNCRGSRGILSFVDNGPIRTQVGVLDSLQRLSRRHAAMRSVKRIFDAAGSPGGYRCIWRNPGGAGVGDRG